MLNFDHQFGEKWMMNLTLGNNMYESYSKEITAFGIGLLVPGYYNITNSPAQFAFTFIRQYRNAAFYGDLEITYKRMLYLTLTGRNEWSTTLPRENNSFFYPSASISWVFTELEGLRDLKAIPFGKLRISFAGIANAPEMYKTSTYYETSFIGDTWVYGLRFPFFGITSFDISNTLGNAELKPEKTTTWEIGTDLRFIDNRIALDFTYFNSYARDLLLNVPVANSSGFVYIYTNAGEMSSRGIEVVLNMIPLQRQDWSWNTSFNFTRARSVVKKLAPNIDMIALTGIDYVAGGDAFLIIYDPVIGAREGDDYQTFYGYDWLRDDDGNLIINDNPESPGYGFPMGNYDAIVNAGRFTPDWILGWNNTVRWKNLSLSFLLEFKKGGLMYNGTKSDLYYHGVHGDQENRGPGDLVVFEGVKQSDGSPNDIQVVKDENWYYWGEGSAVHGPAVPFLEETSWIRLREIILSYRLGQKALGNGFIKSLEFYLSGRNLLLFTKYSGVDPESSATGPSNAQGFDDFNWPGTKGLTFGLKAEF